MDKYCLPDGYVHRIDNSFFDDSPYTDEYQNEVYNEALVIANRKGYKSILDIGTGSGFKLIKYFSDLDTFGVDIEPTVTFLKGRYPDRKWGTIEEAANSYDMIICSDVIEHIPEPDDFINMILGIDFKEMVISTPDRSTLYNSMVSPPLNTAHVREWTMEEFNCYMSKYFTVINQVKIKPNTQVIVCRKK